jgi:hypothetical protein
MEERLSSLCVDAARYLGSVIRNSRHKAKDRRWNFEDKMLALAVMKHLNTDRFCISSFNYS